MRRENSGSLQLRPNLPAQQEPGGKFFLIYFFSELLINIQKAAKASPSALQFSLVEYLLDLSQFSGVV